MFRFRVRSSYLGTRLTARRRRRASAVPQFEPLEGRALLSAVPVYAQPPSASGGQYKSAWYAPNGLDGDQYCWDNFTLGTTQTINQIEWSGGYTNSLQGAGQSPVTDFTLSIYASIAAQIQPDVTHAPLAQFDVGGNAGETPAGVVNGVQMYDYSFTLPTGFQAVAGVKYWLQIEATQGVTPTYSWPPDWSWAVGTGGDNTHFEEIIGGTLAGGNLYSSFSNDLAFTLLTNSTASPLTPTLTLSNGPFTYNGNPQGATANATGAGGATIAGSWTYQYYTPIYLPIVAPTNAGSYIMQATFTSSDPNYASAAISGSFTISPAIPNVAVSGGPFLYDGTAHAATATVTGVGGVPVNGSVSLVYTQNGTPATPVNAGSYLAAATFTSSDPNYGNATGTGTLTINASAPGVPTISVGGGPFVYDGTVHASTATAIGSGGAAVPGTFTYSYTQNGAAVAPINAGTYSVVATFTSNDSAYANTSASGTLVVSAAAPIVTVTGGPYIYDGATHSASARAIGVGGASVKGTLVYTYNGAASAKAAGSYAVAVNFTSSDPNYTGAVGTGIVVIGKATPKITVLGGTYTFDGKAHTANALVVGCDRKTPVAGTLTVGYNGSTKPPKMPGTYTVVARFTSSDSNYGNATAVGNLVILPRGKRRHR